MIYKELCGERVSALGMGTMRLPLEGGRDSEICMERAAEMVDYALKNGINYFDTAYGYHRGRSEPVMGELLSAYPRDSFFLATKFPGFAAKNFARIEEIFNDQLKRCRTDHFDFYLFHNVSDSNVDNYLDPQYDLFGYLLKQKAEGRIKHLGFSSHGSYETVKRFLDAGKGELEFCQLQVNWLDWSFQNAKARVELLAGRGLPVWIMEPVRGGKLVNLPESAAAALKNAAPERTLAEWALRFVQGIPNVGVTLSGMSDMRQLAENIRIFSEEKPLCADELKLLDETAKQMFDCVPCTACAYCVGECPQQLDIPQLMSLYNELVFTDGTHIPEGIAALGADKHPSACIGCGSCAAVCPQEIKIPEVLSDFTGRI